MEAVSLTVEANAASFDAALTEVESSMEASSMEVALVEALLMNALIMQMALMELLFDLTIIARVVEGWRLQSRSRRLRSEARVVRFEFNVIVILILKFENDFRNFKMTDRKKNIVTWQLESEFLF